MKDKGFWWCFGIYIFMFFVDLWSTLINLELVKHLEANPLYRFGGLPLIILFNILVLTGLTFWYIKVKKPGYRFYVIWIMTVVILSRIIISYQNYQIYLDPPTIEAAMALTYQQKTAYIFKWSLVLNLLPGLQALITYFFWEKDHKIEVLN